MVLRSELSTIELIVDQLIRSTFVSGKAEITEQPQELLRLLDKECKRLRATWVHHLFSSVKETTISRYVRFHQAALTVLCDKLSDQFIYNNRVAGSGSVGDEALKMLDDLLQGFQNSLPQYFDKEMLETRYRRKQEQTAYQEIFLKLEADLFQRLPGSMLASAISRSINQKLEDYWLEPVSYRQSAVVYQLVVSLKYYLSTKATVNEIELFLFVFKLNLNSELIFNWFKENVTTGSLLSANDARILLEDRAKSVQSPFDPHQVSLEDLILPWLDGLSGPQENGPAPRITVSRVPLTLSVAQFAMFIRICYRTGCFSLTNAAEIIRFFATNFTTKRQDSVSVKSFTKGFYSMDQTSAAIIRDFLQRMIALINKTFFS
jgi:hypothetical protein